MTVTNQSCQVGMGGSAFLQIPFHGRFWVGSGQKRQLTFTFGADSTGCHLFYAGWIRFYDSASDLLDLPVPRRSAPSPSPRPGECACATPY